MCCFLRCQRSGFIFCDWFYVIDQVCTCIMCFVYSIGLVYFNDVVVFLQVTQPNSSDDMITPNGSRNQVAILYAFALTCWTTVGKVFGPCPFRCVCDDSKLAVWCDNAGLDVVPITLNPGLRELYLGNNRIKNIMQSISVYNSLEYLDMSKNQLVSLGKNNFESQGNLIILHLNGNMVSALNNNTFIGLASLQILRLDENFLLEIPSNAFQNLSSLETLDLSQNRISSLSPKAFNGLYKLRRLLLRDNKLGQVPTASFQKTLGLQFLDLGLNSFQTIPGNAFFPLIRLKTLVLDGCGVQMVQQGAFKRLDSLHTLHLEDNELFSVPVDALGDIGHLEELHIGQNKMQQFNANSFQRFTSLRTLVVSGCHQLERIDKGAFEDNIRMEKIVINHNRNLVYIDPEAFQHLSHLRYVSLRGNAFFTLPEDLLPWEKLDYFDVRDNPLACNCSLLWLWNLLRSKNFTIDSPGDTSRVLCASPSHLRDRPLSDSRMEDLDCYQDTRRQILTGTVAAAGILILATIMLGLWHRQKIARALEKKWKQDQQETQYQRSETPENRYGPMTRVVRPMPKISPITEL